MKTDYDKIALQIEGKYGRNIADQNADYVLERIAKHMKKGVLNDDLPLPSERAAIKTIILIIDHNDRPWKDLCYKDDEVRNVIDYLFIRAQNHYDEVRAFVKVLLSHNCKHMQNKTIIAFLNLCDHMFIQKPSNAFIESIVYPNKSEEILKVLHELIDNQTGKYAAQIMESAYEEGLINDINYKTVSIEFKTLKRSAYTEYLTTSPNNRAKDDSVSKSSIKRELSKKLGYYHNSNNTISFYNDKSTRKSLFYSIFRYLKFFTSI